MLDSSEDGSKLLVRHLFLLLDQFLIRVLVSLDSVHNWRKADTMGQTRIIDIYPCIKQRATSIMVPSIAC